MQKKKQTLKIKQIWKNNKRVCSMLLIAALVGAGATTYFVTHPRKNVTEQTVDSDKKEETGKKSEQPVTPVNPPAPPTSEEEKKEVLEKPANNANLPEISSESPKLTRSKIEEIKLEMTEDDIKSIVGNDVYEAAKKAGQNLGSITLNVSDAKGGVALGIEQGKLISLTRTYDLKTNTEGSFTQINQGMSIKEVVSRLGLPTTETGGKGTFVYMYPYMVNDKEQTKIVVFDENDKVLVVQ